MEKVLDAVAGSLAQAGPEWVIALGALAIAAWVTAKGLPIYKATKLKRIEIEVERETRKAEEARRFDDREHERSAIAVRQVDAQERSTATINAMTAQMAMMNASLDESKCRSREMGMTVGAMADQVDEIHDIVVGCKIGGTE
ncbi:hypothetical protein [Raoultibacter phocaeensis]|uniref:hypothetical protein n=1 Tax=Raoultibacter phocaeensis TaxID=2479841 RepID=UPI001117C898|nr:hypothetical protein [Raoultibacter phocaeensis]